MQQRKLRVSDLDLLAQTATQIAPDAYLLMQADADREIARRKRDIQKAGTPAGTKVVADGETIVTCYLSTNAA